MLQRMKRIFGEIARDRPGRRFLGYYRRRKDRNDGYVMRTLAYMLAAVLLIIGGALAVLPGPAFVFFILAFTILAARSRRVAVLLDQAELFGRRQWDWVRKRFCAISGRPSRK